MVRSLIEFFQVARPFFYRSFLGRKSQRIATWTGVLKILVFAKKVNCAVRAYLEKYLPRAVHLSTTSFHSHLGHINVVHLFIRFKHFKHRL